METEQAHSLGSARLSAITDSPRRVPPLIWLNLVCLDAPLVAIAWLWLFAATFRIPLQMGNCVALFLTAWLIYLSDRLADSTSLKAGFPRSLRQEFCLRHREIWIATVLLVGGFDAYVIWRTTALATFLVGAVVGGLAVIYLVINHPLGLIWRSLPAKELAIGVLFTAGTLVALMPAIGSLTPAFTVAALAFAILCALNCASIAGWERELDREQEKVSIATRHPSFTRHVGAICALLGLLAFGLALTLRGVAVIFACIGVSAVLLSTLNASPRFKEGINRGSLGLTSDQRTALADLVLLTPLVVLLFRAL